MRRSRDEQDRIALRLPSEMKLEAERLARLSGERHVSDYYRQAIEAHNERLRERLERESSSSTGPPAFAPGPLRHLKANPSGSRS